MTSAQPKHSTQVPVGPAQFDVVDEDVALGDGAAGLEAVIDA